MYFREKGITTDNQFQITEFVAFVEDLVQMREFEQKQQILNNPVDGKPDYRWLSTKKEDPVKLDLKQIQMMKQLASKLSSDECSNIAMQAANILMTTEKDMDFRVIPTFVCDLLTKKHTNLLLEQTVPRRPPILKMTGPKKVVPDGQHSPTVSFVSEPIYIIFDAQS